MERECVCVCERERERERERGGYPGVRFVAKEGVNIHVREVHNLIHHISIKFAHLVKKTTWVNGALKKTN